jgi:hypothetical protein
VGGERSLSIRVVAVTGRAPEDLVFRSSFQSSDEGSECPWFPLVPWVDAPELFERKVSLLILGFFF